MEQNYPGNSDRQMAQGNAPQPAVQKRVTAPAIDGGAQIKKKTSWDSVREFFGIQECKSFRDYVSALSDMTNRVYGAIDMLLGNNRYQNVNVPGAKVSYSRCFNGSGAQPAQAQVQAKTSPEYGFDYQIEYFQLAKAEAVLASMHEVLRLYHNVSIDDMFDLAGITSPLGPQGTKYGWVDLTGVRPIPYGGKYILNLPPAVPIR